MLLAASLHALHQLPPWYTYTFAFVIGATVGSFLNVCIYRIPEEGVTVFYPAQSRCPHCGYQLRWYDNIPILSYLMLRGQCRQCKAPISLQYPLVELITAVMAVAIVKRFGIDWPSLLFFVMTCGLIVVIFIDLAHWIIPDVISLPGIVIGIGASVLLRSPHIPSWQEATLGAVIGGGIFLLISEVYERATQRTGMGMGDVKLLAMIGAFLGLAAIPMIILLSALQGMITAIALYALGWRHGAPEFDEFEDDEADAQATSPLEAEELSSTETSPQDGEKASAPDASEQIAFEQEQALAEATAAQESVALGQASGSESTASADVVAAFEDTPESDEATARAKVEPKITEIGEASQDEHEFEEEEAPSFGQVAVPFGPFLALAAIEYLFWGPWLLRKWSDVVNRMLNVFY